MSWPSQYTQLWGRFREQALLPLELTVGVRAELLQCPTLCDPMDCSPRQASLSLGLILQAKILEWVAMPSSRESSQPRDQTESHVSCIGKQVLYH